MNDGVPVREVMSAEYVGASEADRLAETAELVLEEGVDAAVVLRGSEAVGTLTGRDVLATVLGDGLEDATVADAMRSDPPTIHPDQPLAEAVRLLSGESARHLLVTDEEGPLGVVSPADLVAATSLAPVPIATDPAGREEALADASGAGGEYSEQGICEDCGRLTRELSAVDGRLVCPDCMEV